MAIHRNECENEEQLNKRGRRGMMMTTKEKGRREDEIKLTRTGVGGRNVIRHHTIQSRVVV